MVGARWSLVRGGVRAGQARCGSVPALPPPPGEGSRADICNEVVGGTPLSVHKVAFCAALF